jgi:hypothetical protein
MLHHRSGDGRLLWGETARIRNRGIEDHTAVTESESDFAGLEFPQGHGKERADTYEIETRAGDKYDVRSRPEVGD